MPCRHCMTPTRSRERETTATTAVHWAQQAGSGDPSQRLSRLSDLSVWTGQQVSTHSPSLCSRGKSWLSKDFQGSGLEPSNRLGPFSRWTRPTNGTSQQGGELWTPTWSFARQVGDEFAQSQWDHFPYVSDIRSIPLTMYQLNYQHHLQLHPSIITTSTTSTASLSAQHPVRVFGERVSESCI